jgi:hypothetical protein
MNNPTEKLKPKQSFDTVLQEIWRAKDSLSAAYGHDVDRLFADTRERQRQSGRPVVNRQAKRPKV